MKDLSKELKRRINSKLDAYQRVDCESIFRDKLTELWWVLSEIDDIEEENKTGLSMETRRKIAEKKELEERLNKLNKELAH